ncbi:hypothetical protein FCH28_24460 [Streptomyces piniterrae]|uniref:Uncharacterized protein n=1 Tax=Streptomyces piniterrae TaxID=2571125 RepID=A0A4U0N787_9ACTN|nr:hypothetical protein FCH28_24460 [Streptomyces piniterrae]
MDFTTNVAHGPEPLAKADTVFVPASHEEYEPRTAELHAPLAAAWGRCRLDWLGCTPSWWIPGRH